MQPSCSKFLLITLIPLIAFKTQVLLFAHGLSRPSNNKNTFSNQVMIPPLEKSSSTSSTTMKDYGSSLPVLYTNSGQSAERWLEQHVSPHSHVGFDVESISHAPWLRNVKFRGAATVQIATEDAALILQLVDNQGQQCTNLLHVLQPLLSDDSIILTGIGIDADMIELYNLDDQNSGNTDIVGRFDLGGVGGTKSRTTSLQRLTKAVLGVNLLKSKKLATSNWGQVPLTHRQIAYSARDAWAAAACLSELALRNSTLFCQEALLELISTRHEEEIPIKTLSRMAKERKIVKANWKSKKEELKALRTGSETSITNLSNLKRQEEELFCEMRKLAPPQPAVFVAEHVGITFDDS